MPEPTPEQIAAAKSAWKAARSFADLCELTAQFAEGKSPFFPSTGETEAGESEDVSTYLAAINRAGFLTTCSQAGIDEADWKQRVFVDGFAMEPTARGLVRMGLFTDLYVLACQPGHSGGFHIPVTVDDFRPMSWSGFTTGDELASFENVCQASAIGELRRAWFVSIIDLSWGRKDYLWRRVAEVICYSEIPEDAAMIGTHVGPVA